MRPTQDGSLSARKTICAEVCADRAKMCRICTRSHHRHHPIHSSNELFACMRCAFVRDPRSPPCISAAAAVVALRARSLNSNPLAGYQWTTNYQPSFPANYFIERRDGSIRKFASWEKGVQTWGSSLIKFASCKLVVAKLPTPTRLP